MGVSAHPRGACRADPRIFWQDNVSNLGQKTFVSFEDLGSYSQRLLKEISLFSVKMVDAAITVIVIPLKSSLIWQNDPKKRMEKPKQTEEQCYCQHSSRRKREIWSRIMTKRKRQTWLIPWKIDASFPPFNAKEKTK